MSIWLEDRKKELEMTESRHQVKVEDSLNKIIEGQEKMSKKVDALFSRYQSLYEETREISAILKKIVKTEYREDFLKSD